MSHTATHDSNAEAYRQTKYRPEPERTGVALCLSGGGFRAALFHLGALTRLNELGLLGSVDTVSCVSGGSIVGALLADRLRPWPGVGEVVPAGTWNPTVVDALTAFTSRDLRSGPIARQLMPWNWGRLGVGARRLAAHYREGITGLRLAELPVRPRFLFCATDLVFGVDFVFERDRIGSYYGVDDTGRDMPVALAVAASSCFPPIFNPLPIGVPAARYRGGVGARKHVPEWAEKVGGIEVTDGGDYDNLGLEPVWKRSRIVLVSDGGAPFQVRRDRGLPWRLQRYAEIATNQAGALRKRWLVSDFLSGVQHGAYWGISSSADHYCDTAVGYPEDVVRQFIASVRTDMDVFSAAEAQVLQNHGYTLADAAMTAHPPPGLSPRPVPAVCPFPEQGVDAVRRSLKDSSKRSILGHQRWWYMPGKIVRG